MHLNAHAFAGAAIAATGYNLGPGALLAAAPLAIASHCLMDKIGEPRDWTRAQHTLFDGAFMALFAAAAVAAGPEMAWVMLFGAVFGNIPDIMDKRGYLSIFWPDWFPARRWWFCHRKGYETFQPTSAHTVLFSAILYAATLWSTL